MSEEAEVAQAEPQLPHKLRKEFTVERDGKTFVLYAGLLDKAHELGLKRIETEIVQIPNDQNGNVAIVHAIVEIEQGTFTGIGDASPGNVNRMMAPHLLRMSETRAKARALRDAVNIGVTALEELDDSGYAGQQADSRTTSTSTASSSATRSTQVAAPPRSTQSVAAPPRQQPAQSAPARQVSGPPATPKQLETIERMGKQAGKSIDTDGLTRGQASEIISGLLGEMGGEWSDSGHYGSEDRYPKADSPAAEQGESPAELTDDPALATRLDNEPGTNWPGWEETITVNSPNGNQVVTRRHVWTAYQEAYTKAVIEEQLYGTNIDQWPKQFNFLDALRELVPAYSALRKKLNEAGI